MVWDWLKKHSTTILTALVTVGFLFYCYSCQSTTQSLVDDDKQVNRQELQLEFDTIITLAQIRMLDLDKQEQFRSIILQNAMVLVQGNPLNPLGIITAVAAIYGIAQGGTNVVKKVKNNSNKRKANNG